MVRKKFMKFFIKNSVFEVYSIFYVISKICGLGTFKFQHGDFQNCPFGILLFILSWSLTTLYFVKQKTTQFTFSKVLSSGMYYIDHLPVFAMFFFMFLNFWNRKNFHSIFQQLRKFDKKVGVVHGKTFFLIAWFQIELLVKPQHTRHFMILSAFVAMKFMLTVIEFSTLKEFNFYEVTRTTFCNAMFIFNQLPGSVLISLTKNRFRLLNEFNVISKTSKTFYRDLKQTLSLAYQLFDIVDLIGQTFGLQLLASLIVNWISGIFCSFSGFEVFVLGNRQYEKTWLTLAVYNGLDTIDFFIICWLMSSMKNEV